MSEFIKKIKSSFKSSVGFTLIELLVVIGILGILASALVATIDPFEQLKKANDANVKNAAVEYLNANVRYYTTHNVFPWAAVADGGNACNEGVAPDGTKTLNDATLSTCVTSLIDDKELKAGFSTATNIIKEIYVKYGSVENEVTVCLKPQSASQQRDKNTKFTSAGEAGLDCKSFTPPGKIDCYWCTK